MPCIKSLSSPILVVRFAAHLFSATAIQRQQIRSVLKRSVVLVEANLVELLSSSSTTSTTEPGRRAAAPAYEGPCCQVKGQPAAQYCFVSPLDDVFLASRLMSLQALWKH